MHPEMLIDDHCITIDDKFAKARHHKLIIAREQGWCNCSLQQMGGQKPQLRPFSQTASIRANGLDK